MTDDEEGAQTLSDAWDAYVNGDDTACGGQT